MVGGVSPSFHGNTSCDQLGSAGKYKRMSAELKKNILKQLNSNLLAHESLQLGISGSKLELLPHRSE